jgi:hypothetical protein
LGSISLVRTETEILALTIHESKDYILEAFGSGLTAVAIEKGLVTRSAAGP